MVVLIDCKKALLKYRVEWMVFVYGFFLHTATTAAQSLLLQKVCFPEGPPGTNVVCNNTTYIKMFSSISSVRSMLRECLPGLVVLFAGPWRDHTGRSLPLALITQIGEVIALVALLTTSLMWNFSPWASAIIESGVSGIMGGRQMMTVAILSYISEHTPRKERAVRVSLVMVASMGGTCAASAASGFILSALDYGWLFGLSLIAFLGNIVFACFAMKESPRLDTNVKALSFEPLKRMGKVFQPRKNQGVIWVMICISCIIVGYLNSEASVTYAFLQKVLHLNPESAGILSSYKQLLCIFGAALIPLFTKVLHLSEFLILVLCHISSAISCFGMGISKTVGEAYIFYTFDLFRILLLSMAWTIITRCIRKSELGVYQSFIALGESLTPFALNPLYLYIFNNTIESFPGAYFMCSGVLIVTCGAAVGISKFFYVDLEKDGELDLEGKSTGDDKKIGNSTSDTS